MRSIEHIRREYRYAWLGTIAGVIVILLTIGLALELQFAGRYFGPGHLPMTIAKMALPPLFLFFLILRDRKTMEPLEKVRTFLLAALFLGLFSTWFISLTNRWPRNDSHQYQINAKLLSHQARFSSRFGKSKPDPGAPPSYYYVEVALPSGEEIRFTTPEQQFKQEDVGKLVALPVVRGRWGQDFIAISE